MKKKFCKILLGLGCVAILGNISSITQSLSTPDNTAVVKEETYTQIQYSDLCIAPYHDGLPFED